MNSSGYKDDKTLSGEENRKRREAMQRAFMEGPSIFDCIADCEDAVRYIRQNADALGVDPQKLVSIGDSSGAHLAACLGTLAPGDARVNAMVLCSSISDLTYKFGRNSIKPSPGFEGKELEEDPDRLKRAKAASPLFNISKDTASVLILHGQRDWLGDEPERFHEALRAGGVDVEYKVYPTAKHAFIVYGYSATDEQITQTILDIDAFLLKRGYLEPGVEIQMPFAGGE
jgi:acetyl esterase/lipase